MPKVRHSRPNATGRNDTARFVALPHYLLRCPAWRTMSPNAKALLLDVWTRHNGANNGEIAYAVREAEGIGIGKSQAAVAMAELQERGFLKVSRASTFTLKTKEARTWELTAERRGDQPASKDFMRWRPEPTNAPTTNRTRSGISDAQSGRPDTKPRHATKLPGSVRHIGPSSTQTTVSRSGGPDTSNLPWGSGQTARSEPQRSGAARISSAGGDATAERGPRLLGDIVASILPAHRLAAGRTRADRRGPPDQGPGGIAEARPVGVEDLLGISPDQAAAPSPAERLRADLARHVDSAPPGELQRLAERVGLSRPQLSNFKAGRFGLNPTAAAVLRQILDGAA